MIKLLLVDNDDGEYRNVEGFTETDPLNFKLQLSENGMTWTLTVSKKVGNTSISNWTMVGLIDPPLSVVVITGL